MTSPVTVPALQAGELYLDVLGAGSSVPTAARDTTSLLLGAPDGWTLIDCPGAIVHKLALRGLRPADLRRVILTHDHVDHVYGLPHLLQALKIGGYEDELELYAPPQTLATVDAMLAAHRQRRPGYPRLQARPVDGAGEVEITSAGVTLRFAPMRHGRDTVAVRCDAGEGSVCHSADTAPCAELARLARDVGLLLHDCAGPGRLQASFAGAHSSAREAGEAARAARAGALALIHLGVADDALVEECVAEARAAFDGPVSAACDGDRWRLPERS